MPCLMDFRCIKSSPGLYPRRLCIVWQPSVYRVEGYPWVLNTRASEKFSTVDGVQLRRGAVLGGGTSVNAGLYRYISYVNIISHIRITCIHFELDSDRWLRFDRLRIQLIQFGMRLKYFKSRYPHSGREARRRWPETWDARDFRAMLNFIEDIS